MITDGATNPDVAARLQETPYALLKKRSRPWYFDVATPSGPLASDTYTAADTTLLNGRTADTGGTWTQFGGATGDAEITGNALRNSAAATSFHVLAPTISQAVVKAEATFHKLTGTVAGYHCLAVTDGVDSWYQVAYNTLGTPKFELYKWCSGWTLLDSWTSTLADDTSATVRLEVSNGVQQAYIDGTLRLSASDTAINAFASAGVRFQTDSGDPSVLRIDDFTIDEAGAHTTTPTALYTETLDTVINSIAEADGRQHYRDTANVLLTAGVSVGAVQSMVESVVTLAQGSAAATAAQQYADTLDDTLTATGQAAEAQQYSDSLDTTAAVSDEAAGAQHYVETLDEVLTGTGSASDVYIGSAPLEVLTTVATSAATVDAAQAYVDTVTTVAQGAASLAEALTLVEQLGSVGTAIGSVSERQQYFDDVAVVARGTGSISEIGSYIEQLMIISQAAASVVDVYSSEDSPLGPIFNPRLLDLTPLRTLVNLTPVREIRKVMM